MSTDICPQKNWHLICANTVKLFLHAVFLYNISHKISQLIKKHPASIPSGPKQIASCTTRQKKNVLSKEQLVVLSKIAVIGSY